MTSVAKAIVYAVTVGIGSFLISYIFASIAVQISIRRYRQQVEAIHAEFMEKAMKIRPRARWEGEEGDYHCSRCGMESPHDGYLPSGFCFECGAYMMEDNGEATK